MGTATPYKEVVTMNILLLLAIVFGIPALITYLLANKGNVFGILAALLLPHLSIYVIDTVFTQLAAPANPEHTYSGAPMTLVVYGLYGVPSSIVSLIVLFKFKNTRA